MARAATSVWLFTMSWNEERMLPFFFRHYDPWVDRYVIYDDGSTDDTLALLAAHPKVAIRRFERVVPTSFVRSAQYLHDRFWQESRGLAAWAVVTAIDEHLHQPDMRRYLARCRHAGVTAIPALGFHMLSETSPSPGDWLAETHTVGAPHWEMCKLSILDPNAIETTNYHLGRHFAEPTGRVVYPEIDEVVNLHYKYLNRDRTRERHRMLHSGLGTHDIEAGLGNHYAMSDEQFDEHWQKLGAKAIDFRDPAVGFSTHVGRWWRGPRRR
jgi:hypothetical protein